MEPRSASPGPFPAQARFHSDKLEAKPLSYKIMSEKRRRSPSPEKMGRTSFSSVREEDCDLAQTFTASKVSCYNSSIEQAIQDLPDKPARRFTASLGQDDDQLESTCFTDWRQVHADSEMAIESLPDSRRLRSALTGGENRATDLSHLERLPTEVFGLIVRYLVVDIPPNGVDRRNVDLVSLLLTSKTVNAQTVETVYRRVTIPHSRIFQKFLVQIMKKPLYGEWVRRLDFSHFNPSTLFSTAKERAEARNLTAETLLQCLQLTPSLQEFLAQEYIDDDLNSDVLRTLFLGLDRLQAVDFCGCSSGPFRDAFASARLWSWPDAVAIRRLSLHKCRTLPSHVFETILPRLKRLTHLDVTGTKITDAALSSIPVEARITHLNLAACKQLSAESIIEFFETHPAVRRDLVFLSLATDVKTQDSFEPADVSRLLRILPRTLKSLSLKGSKMDSSHIPLLLPFTKHLEELALGNGLKISDVDRLFAPDESLSTEEQLAWVPSSLRYIDMSDMWSGELAGLYTDCILLTRASQPLEVIEFSEEVVKSMKKSPGPVSRAGWRLSEIHRRSWLVRVAGPGEPRDDGRRPWKIGAQFWGMRKIPVANADVGGMYGSFMFGRHL